MKKSIVFILILIICFLTPTNTIYGLPIKAHDNKSLVVDGDYFSLTPLPYESNALEPFIDSTTIELHHNKHEQNYVTNLNAAINKIPNIKIKYNTLEELLANENKLPKELRNTIITNGGGVYNHTFFWKSLSPTGGGNPIGNLRHSIEAQYGSFENFKAEFEKASLNLSGSGWVWLLSDKKGTLFIETTTNQCTPLSSNKTPLLNLDLWEHSYYLKYQNRRNEYVLAFWNIVNWTFAENNYINSFRN